MGRSLFIFSSKLFAGKRLLVVLLCVVASAWLTNVVVGPPLAEYIAVRYEPMLRLIGRGKIAAPSVFVRFCLDELCVFLTVVAVCIGLIAYVYERLIRRVAAAWRWLPLSGLMFAAVNIAALSASHTMPYWLMLAAGSQGRNHEALFHIKNQLFRETPAEVKVAILGSSQAGSQIDEDYLNRLFGPAVHFANFTYVGVMASDLPLVQSWYAPAKPDVVICYLSERDFFQPVRGDLYLPLLKFASWLDLADLGTWRFISRETRNTAFIGNVLPLFKARRALEAFVYGHPITDVALGLRRAHRVQLEALPQGAERLGASYQFGQNRDQLNKRAFERFLQLSATANAVVMVIVGQLNPMLSAHIKPQVTQDFRQYLHDLPARYPHLIVLEEELPSHPKSVYVDLTHINKAEQRRFTAQLGHVLQQRFGWRRKPPQSAFGQPYDR